jgi:hypothetical protein
MVELESTATTFIVEREIHPRREELKITFKKLFHPIVLALALCICPGDDVFAIIAASASATQLDQQIIIPESPRLQEWVDSKFDPPRRD